MQSYFDGELLCTMECRFVDAHDQCRNDQLKMMMTTAMLLDRTKSHGMQPTNCGCAESITNGKESARLRESEKAS